VEFILRRVLPYAPSGQLVFITLRLLGISFIGAVIMGLIAGIYPAFRASSMRPVEAIRLGD
ncbi:MAG: ABC transporter permease, partial [Candidatus Omnitrophica bacterium]|nr:ABC transporter permease [Candidatus Omnitrophota bacterium]